MKQIPQQVSAAVRRRNPHLYGKLAHDGPREDATIKVPKRIRQSSKPLLNDLEEKYLATLKATFPIVHSQSVKLRLANGLTYTPDFVVFSASQPGEVLRTIAWEVKGPHAFDGALDKLKMAAAQFPAIKFVLVWKDQGRWCQQEVLP